MHATTEEVLFEEQQQFRQPWVWALLLGVLVIESAAFMAVITQTPGGAGVLIFIGVLALLLGVIWLMYSLKLTVRVHPDRVHIHFFPLTKRDIPLEEIASHEARTYRPILEYGGWGLRYSFTGHGRAYNVSGNRGVQLTLRDGSRLLIGSQCADELADAIAAAKSRP